MKIECPNMEVWYLTAPSKNQIIKLQYFGFVSIKQYKLNVYFCFEIIQSRPGSCRRSDAENKHTDSEFRDHTCKNILQTYVVI